MDILLDKNKKFFKANLHTHSVNSDGKLTVEEVKKIYKDKGYSAVAFSDHDVMVDNSHLNDDDFIAITAAEIGVREDYIEARPQSLTMKNLHFNLFALDPHNAIDFYKTVITELPDIHKNYPLEVQEDGRYEKIHCDFSIENINKILKLANEKGFIVSMNHPRWSMPAPEEYLKIENIFAVEIINYACAKSGVPTDESVAEQMLRAGKKVFMTAADDSHNWDPIDSPYNDSFGGWVQINAEELTYDNIMNALKSGDFYASTGPEIFSLKKDGEKVYVESSDCEKICYLTKSRRATAVMAEKGSSVNSAEFEIKPTDGFFRIKVIDKYGKIAYSQAYDV